MTYAFSAWCNPQLDTQHYSGSFNTVYVRGKVFHTLVHTRGYGIASEYLNFLLVHTHTHYIYYSLAITVYKGSRMNLMHPRDV